ncbi:hypothetical protein CRM22_011412 [Opisthorchis felineus]|uniref:Nodule Cysteine-Rich (NCR) secreted peptide n=1 Tax=Opisthorchis felineus TaxID=147828 RepID=A0A4S2JF77_OPIFE|nr:hypothetical protein CRM22_011412 [Opisthorchis felineus]
MHRLCFTFFVIIYLIAFCGFVESKKDEPTVLPCKENCDLQLKICLCKSSKPMSSLLKQFRVTKRLQQHFVCW